MEEARQLLDEGLKGTGKAKLAKLEDRVLEELYKLLGGSLAKDAPVCKEYLVSEIMKMKRKGIPNKVSPYFAKERKLADTVPTFYDSDTETVVEGFKKIFDAPAVLQTKRDEAPGRRDPPDPHIQLLRTAGACQPLIDFLKANGKFDKPGRTQWNTISQWTKSVEGMDWLRRCQLDPLGAQLDHVCARSGVGSGFDSVYNCYFLPPSANGWFGEFDTREKRAYVGKHAVELSKRYSSWIRQKVTDLAKRDNALFNQNTFDPHVIH